MKRNEILEARWGSSYGRSYNPLDQERREQGYMDQSKRDFKRREMEHELGHEDEWNRQQARSRNYPRSTAPVSKGMYFYNVKPGQESDAMKAGLKQTKSGKWFSKAQSAAADQVFGKGRYWEPKTEGVSEELTGRQRYEEMKDRIASVLIKLYDRGNDKETIQQMGERVAKHLGYDSQDPIYKQAWMTSFTDASLDGAFDDDEFDYTDYSMRKGEMGEGADDQLDEFLPVVGAALGGLARGAAAVGKAAVQGVKTVGGAVAQGAKAVGQAVGTGLANAAATPSSINATGSVEKVQGDNVTIKNPDGSTITTKITDLAQDDKGQVVLSKSEIGKNDPQPQQQKPLTPGTKVQVTNSIDVSDIKKLAGL